MVTDKARLAPVGDNFCQELSRFGSRLRLRVVDSSGRCREGHPSQRWLTFWTDSSRSSTSLEVGHDWARVRPSETSEIGLRKEGAGRRGREVGGNRAARGSQGSGIVSISRSRATRVSRWQEGGPHSRIGATWVSRWQDRHKGGRLLGLVVEPGYPRLSAIIAAAVLPSAGPPMLCLATGLALTIRTFVL
jgi:hypothetical protein